MEKTSSQRTTTLFRHSSRIYKELSPLAYCLSSGPGCYPKRLLTNRLAASLSHRGHVTMATLPTRALSRAALVSVQCWIAFQACQAQLYSNTVPFSLSRFIVSTGTLYPTGHATLPLLFDVVIELQRPREAVDASFHWTNYFRSPRLPRLSSHAAMARSCR